MTRKLFISLLAFSIIPAFSINPVEKFVNNPVLQHANVGLLVKNLNTGETLYELNPDNSRTTASTMKAITTATALEMFGPDYRIETKLAIDGEFSHQLQNAFSSLGFNPQAHEEHSTEVQMPFIRHYFKHAPVVEIVYGDITSIELSSIIDTLLVSEKTLVVISTDLSHFYTQEEANALDKHCIAAIQALDEQALSHGCEACGITGIKALVHSAKTHHFTPYLLDYRTSYERTKDASRVVGYTSFVVG